jgi:YVTN family beta-propeller protein
LAYDSGTSQVFVANSGSNTVSVISDSTNTIAHTVTVGTTPDAVAYDSGTSEVFVANSGSNNVSVISDSLYTVAAWVGVGTTPDAVAYDSGASEVFVANSGSNNVSVISDSLNAIAATAVVGTTPAAVAYDSGLSEVFVANSGSDDVSVISDSTNTVVHTVAVRSDPTGAAYDSGTSDVFVANGGSDVVSVISDSTNTVAATVVVGQNPLGVAYDSGKSEIFVANSVTDTAGVISDSTNKALTNVTVGSYPAAVAYDATAAEVFVANYFSGTVSVIRDSTNTVAATVTVGSDPDAAAYDSGTSEVFVSNNDSDTVSVISVSTNTVVHTIPVGSHPDGAAYDSGKGEIFVTNSGAGTVSVISDTTNTVVATITVGSGPTGVAYDSGAGEVFVTNSGSGTVSVISDSTNTVVSTVTVESGPGAAAYDSGTGEIFVSNANSATVSVISDNNNTVVATVAVGSHPDGVTYDSGNGRIYVDNFDQGTVSILRVPPVYTVTFTESGLPGGTEWWVNLTHGRSFSSTSTTLTFSEPNGTYDYAVATTDKEYASPGGSFTVSGAVVSEPVTFSLVTYAVTFTESGLPSGTEWWVNLTNGQNFSSTSTTATFDEPNGTYDYAVATTDKEYAAAGGSFTVNGAVVSEPADFILGTYAVTFTESGLPGGTEWWVNLTNGQSFPSTSTTVTFNEANGTYDYAVATTDKEYAAAGGSFTVMGSAVPETATFRLVTYAVTFTESGLPSGTEWWVNLTNGQSFSSTTTTATFDESNGTYDYAVATTAKEYASAGGSFTVSGAAVPKTATFSLVTYAVTFTESGLAGGTEWWVNLTNGQSFSSTSTTVTFSEVNGTYDYAVATTDKENASAGGTFTVSGAAVSESAPFSLVTYAVTFTESGLSAGTEWWVNLTNGQSFSSTTTTVAFSEPNGTYSYTASAAGRSSVTGTLTVNGQPVAPATLSFHAVSTPGLSTLDYAIVGLVIVLVLIVLVFALVRRRGKAPPTSTTPPSQAGEDGPPSPP